MNAVVYCSSREETGFDFEETARIVGSWIGLNNHVMTYGGVKAGLMHITAESAKSAGAKIVGVIPIVFETRADSLNDEIVYVDNLNSRKDFMIKSGDIFFVLPGGIGTVDEWISTLSQLMITGNNGRKIIVVNISGVFDGVVESLNKMAESVFANNNVMDFTIIVNSVGELKELLETV